MTRILVQPLLRSAGGRSARVSHPVAMSRSTARCAPFGKGGLVKDARERSRNLSAAKALVGQAARFVGQQSIQLHGGMGMTDELAISHHFRRLTAIELTLGDTEHHLERFAGGRG